MIFIEGVYIPGGIIHPKSECLETGEIKTPNTLSLQNSETKRP
jgi:hypothetical protein